MFLRYFKQQKTVIDLAIFLIFIIGLIILNVIVVIAETFNLPKSVKPIINYIDVVSVIIFTIEYILRVWTSDYLYEDTSPVKARIKYIFSLMAIIDLLAVLPFYIPFLILSTCVY